MKTFTRVFLGHLWTGGNNQDRREAVADPPLDRSQLGWIPAQAKDDYPLEFRTAFVDQSMPVHPARLKQSAGRPARSRPLDKSRSRLFGFLRRGRCVVYCLGWRTNRLRAEHAPRSRSTRARLIGLGLARPRTCLPVWLGLPLWEASWPTKLFHFTRRQTDLVTLSRVLLFSGSPVFKGRGGRTRTNRTMKAHVARG